MLHALFDLPARRALLPIEEIVKRLGRDPIEVMKKLATAPGTDPEVRREIFKHLAQSLPPAEIQALQVEARDLLRAEFAALPIDDLTELLESPSRATALNAAYEIKARAAGFSSATREQDKARIGAAISAVLLLNNASDVITRHAYGPFDYELIDSDPVVFGGSRDELFAAKMTGRLSQEVHE